MADLQALERIKSIYTSFFNQNTPSPLQSTNQTNNWAQKIENEANKPKYIIDDFRIFPPEPNDLTDIDAMLKAYNVWFNDTRGPSETTSQCGRYVYNLALRYIEAANSKLITPQSSPVASGGDARTSEFRTNLVRLGYRWQTIAENVTQSEILNLINRLDYHVGDIIIYAGNELPPSSTSYPNYYRYGHAQMYVSAQIHNKDTFKNPRKVIGMSSNQTFVKSGWASSLRDNYKTNFVYKGVNCNKWNLWLCRSSV